MREGDEINHFTVTGFETKISKLYVDRHTGREGCVLFRTGNVYVRCVCGKELLISRTQLCRSRIDRAKYSCGCIPRPRGRLSPGSTGRKPLQLTGYEFGRLTVKEFLQRRGWLCVCKCGNERIVREANKLINDKITQCSVCYAKERAARTLALNKAKATGS